MSLVVHPSYELSQVWNADEYSPGSGTSATALVCGMKGLKGTAGVNDRVKRGDCSNMEGNTAKSIFSHAIDEGIIGLT